MTEEKEKQETESRDGSQLNGAAVLGLILIVCLVVAWLLSTMMTREPGNEIDDIFNDPPVSVVEEEDPHVPGTMEEIKEIFMEEIEHELQLRETSIETLQKQYVALTGIASHLSTFQAASGYLPRSLDEVYTVDGATIPENPFLRGAKIPLIQPGDFAAGAVTYLPWSTSGEAPPAGYILVGYASVPDSGYTIANPSELVEPGVFIDPVDNTLYGVTFVMRDDCTTIELSEYPTTELSESEASI